MPARIGWIASSALILSLGFAQTSHADRSRLESDFLIVPRIDVDGFGPLELWFLIELDDEYQFVLDHTAASEPNATSSGDYDPVSQILELNEIESENGDLYTATLELAAQSPEVVFRIKDAAIIYSATNVDVPLPIRSGVRPRTTSDVPHTQIGVDPVPAVNTELFRRAFSLPDVEQRQSVSSFPGTWGLWLEESVPLANPDVITTGREFAHIHPDGSLHLSLEPGRASDAVQARWAISHPWADERDGWEGLVMLYTPRSIEDLNVIFQLIVDSYNFVTGRNLQATDYY